MPPFSCYCPSYPRLCLSLLGEGLDAHRPGLEEKQGSCSLHEGVDLPCCGGEAAWAGTRSAGPQGSIISPAGVAG